MKMLFFTAALALLRLTCAAQQDSTGGQPASAGLQVAAPTLASIDSINQVYFRAVQAIPSGLSSQQRVTQLATAAAAKDQALQGLLPAAQYAQYVAGRDSAESRVARRLAASLKKTNP